MEEGTPQVITGVFKLAYNRGHNTRTFQVEITHQSLQLQQILHHLQTSKPTGKRPLCPHKILTRRKLAVWRWYNKFLIHKKGRNGWNNKGLQPSFLSRQCIHSTIRKVLSQGEDDDNSQYFLPSSASDDLPPNYPFTRWVLNRKHKVSSCWATTNSLIK